MSEQIECMSTECPWLYSRKKAEDKVDQVGRLRELLTELELNAELGEPPAPLPSPVEYYMRESSQEATPWPDE
jgi:hypothetical protein